MQAPTTTLLKMLSAVTFVLALAESSAAQQPGRPITIIVPYAAGANTPDIVARIIAQELQQRLGQPVIVDNKPGASGNIGTQIAARAAPDGHTLLMAAPAFAQNVGLFKNVPYDPVKDFAPIVQTSAVSNALVVHPSLPVVSAREFVNYVKARPGQLNYSSPGHGTPHHLSMELLKLATAIDIRPHPFQGLERGGAGPRRRACQRNVSASAGQLAARQSWQDQTAGSCPRAPGRYRTGFGNSDGARCRRS